MAWNNTTERRQQIIEAMQAVMAERGYDGASTAEVARRAGLAPGLVHYHFKSKLEILLAVHDALGNAALARIDAFLLQRQGEPAPEQVNAFLDAFLEVASDFDPSVVACWVSLAGEAIRQPEVRERYAALGERLVGRLEELVAAALPASAPKREARRIAVALFATVQGYFVLGAACPGVVPPRTAAGAAREMAAALLAGARKGRRA